VLGDGRVVLADRRGVPGQSFPVGPRGDVPGPDDVVAQPQSADSDAVPGRSPAIGVAKFVHIAVDDVELALLGGEPAERVPDAVPHAVPQTGSGQIFLRLFGVSWVTVGADDLALRSDRPREPVRGVPEPRAELHHAPRTDHPRRELEKSTGGAPDDGEAV